MSLFFLPEHCITRWWCRWYKLWTNFILIWALYSSFFTPMEFGFFRGLPEKLFILDIAGQAAFLIDIFVNFFVAYRDPDTYRMIYSRKSIALRYLLSTVLITIDHWFLMPFILCLSHFNTGTKPHRGGGGHLPLPGSNFFFFKIMLLFLYFFQKNLEKYT